MKGEYGSPRQYLVLRAIRDGLTSFAGYRYDFNDVTLRTVQDELVPQGWLSQVSPTITTRHYSVTERGLQAILNYEVNPRSSGIEQEKYYLDGQEARAAG